MSIISFESNLWAYAAALAPTAIVVAAYPNKKIYFFLHPLLALSAFSTFLSSTKLLRTSKKDANLKLHTLANVVGVASMWGATKVIYDCKIANKKQHLQTPHSWLGVSVLTLVTLQSVAGLAAGLKKMEVTERRMKFKLHRTSGRVVLALIAVTCSLGIKTSFGKKPAVMIGAIISTGVATYGAIRW
jgi:hypothetical protein